MTKDSEFVANRMFFLLLETYINLFVYVQVESFGSQSGKTNKKIVVADCGQL